MRGRAVAAAVPAIALALSLAVAAPGAGRRQGWDAATPAWSPDGRSLAYLAVTVPVARAAVWVSRDGGTPRRLTPPSVRFAQPGTLAWSPRGRLLGLVSRARLVLVDERSGRSRVLTRAGDFDWAPGGDAVALVRGEQGGTLEVVRLSGRSQRLAGGLNRDPAWAPRGGRVAFSRPGLPGRPRLFVVDVATRRIRALGPGWRPSWSPDGRLLAYLAPTRVGPRLAVVGPDGRGRRLLSPPGVEGTARPSWSPDGRWIVYEAGAAGGGPVLVRSRPDGSRAERLGTGHTPAWSPDGRRIAFATTRVGCRMMVAVARADGDGRRLLTPCS